MKTVEYLSPTSIALYYNDPTEFYLMYLSDNRPEKIPQTQPMSVGSAFDAYVKSYLHEALFGKNNDARFGFDALFEAQVEEHNRDWALKAGEHAFNAYRLSGALADMMILLQGASNTPRFEFDLHGAVDGSREGSGLDTGEVILYGKPDLHFITKDGVHVIHDWKVNGFCSRSPTSPAKGYIKLRDGWIGNQSRTHNTSHKDAWPDHSRGFSINVNHKLEDVKEDWANQLSTYGWLLGRPVGDDFITSIDQLACSPDGEWPKVRVAEHRTTVSPEWQRLFYDKAVNLWKVVHSDHFFRDLSKAESQAKCQTLDGVAVALAGEENAAFRMLTRGN